jgi:nicotinamide phosphoribosyltransferase
METVGNVDHVPFSAHDFSFRGMVGRDGGAKSGAGHLLSFVGTDTIPAIKYHEEYYNANIEKELVGTSISATEHSVMCANSDADVRDEYESFRRLIEDIYPHGFVSIVSDTYDFWKVVGEVLPKLKDKIMARNGKVVIRPDSGDPVDIICGRYIPEIKNDEYVKSFEDAKASFYEDLMDELREDTPHGEYGDDSPRGKFKYDGKYYELIIDVEWNRYDKQYYYIDGHRERSCKEFTPSLSHLGLIEALWNIFGGEVNELGYKVLDSHIGAIYGDSITPERAEAICSRLKEKGFASSNIVLGVGSYSFQYTTRDTFSMAYKATWSMINGEEKQLFKDPKTDSGTKRSQRGLVVVTNRTEDGSITLLDGLNLAQKEQMAEIDLLQDVFVDGKLVRDDSLSAIRSRLAGA